MISRFILLYICLASMAIGAGIDTKYTAYSYVFNEFDVPLSYSDDADFTSFVAKNERSMKQFYKRSLKRGKTVLPMMKGVLVGEGVSDLFLYLSMIESGFSSHAISSKKAVGLWQFMPATARQYHLKVCDSYDERSDTLSSTSAAIHYLNKLHRQFGKWYLAAMAYNCGEGCLKRAIHKAGTDSISVLTDNHLKILPKETRDYIRKILLVAMIGESKHWDKSSIDSSSYYENEELTQVEVPAGTSLKKLARLIKMDYQLLQKLNKRMKNERVPTYRPSYKITIPLDKIYAFYLRYELLSEHQSERTHLISYKVKMGDSLESIALSYRADVAEIMQTNHLMDSFLEVGQFLVIPVTQGVFDKLRD